MTRPFAQVLPDMTKEQKTKTTPPADDVSYAYAGAYAGAYAMCKYQAPRPTRGVRQPENAYARLRGWSFAFKVPTRCAFRAETSRADDDSTLTGTNTVFSAASFFSARAGRAIRGRLLLEEETEAMAFCKAEPGGSTCKQGTSAISMQHCQHWETFLRHVPSHDSGKAA